MFERTIALIGEEKFDILSKSSVLIVGLGGVGGYVLESLVRSGIGTIGLCDFDNIDETNINRQILATHSNICESKVTAAKKRAIAINPKVNIVEYNFKLTNPIDLELEKWDFVCDAIDDVKAKIALISACPDKIISSMGTGNKMDPFKYQITTIDKTSDDPLARSVRRLLKDEGITKLPVLFSTEKPVVTQYDNIPTISYMPAIAGLEISSYIIKRLLEN